MEDIKNLAPMRILKLRKREFPEVFEAADDLRQNEQFEETYPHSAVYIPTPVVTSIMLGKKAEPVDAYGEAVALSALVGWRRTKMVYDFDETLTETLYEQASADMPISASMFAFPAHCIYIRPNDAEKDTYDGFFAFLDYNDKQQLELRILAIDRKGRELTDMFFTLPEEGEMKLCDILERQYRERRDNEDEQVWESFHETFSRKDLTLEQKKSKIALPFAHLLSLLVYLTAVNAETRQVNRDFRRTRKVRDIPREVEYLKVGENTGVRLRKMKERIVYEQQDSLGGHHRSPVMHVRKAHYHTYLVGEGRKKKRLKWLAPIIVNGEEAEEITVTKVH